MKDWIRGHEADIANLTKHTFTIDGKTITGMFEVVPALLDGKCRKAIYTAALEEAVRLGHRFKTHGNIRKLDYKTCTVHEALLTCLIIRMNSFFLLTGKKEQKRSL